MKIQSGGFKKAVGIVLTVGGVAFWFAGGIASGIHLFAGRSTDLSPITLVLFGITWIFIGRLYLSSGAPGG